MTRSLDPSRVADARLSLRCPHCGATCIRETHAGTPTLQRIQVECSDPLCGFARLVEIPTPGSPPCETGAAKPPPSPPTPAPPPEVPATSPAPTGDSPVTEIRTMPTTYDSLTRSEKMRLAWWLKANQGATIEQWDAVGRPKASKTTATPPPVTPEASAPTLPGVAAKLAPLPGAIRRQAVDAAPGSPSRIRVVMVEAEMSDSGLQQVLDQIGRMFTATPGNGTVG